MKRILIVLIIVMSYVAAKGQSVNVVGRRLIALDSIYVNGVWIKGQDVQKWNATSSNIQSIQTISTNASTVGNNAFKCTYLVNSSTSNVILTLNPSFIGQEFIIKKISTNDNNLVIIQPTSGNIDGNANEVLNIPYSTLTIQWDGINYWIL